ncbi:MAG: hypothetical protein II147_06735 [Lachnospiraceae bacterium]|nr:hypothetical protein [Lachnospiraceae bacterium]
MNTILIIEDDSALREELNTLLTNSGYNVEVITAFVDVAEKFLQTGFK